MKVLSIQVGRGRPIAILGQNKSMITGAFKHPTEGPVFLGPLGLDGDDHIAKEVHGGEGRALYAFSWRAYDFWRDLVSEEILRYGLFGENITLDDLDESKISVGDVFTIGEAEIQATMPRFPCMIFASRMGREDAPELLHDSARPGVLFRVLKTGSISMGDELKLKEKSPHALTITDFFAMGRGRRFSQENAAQLRSIPILPQVFLDVLAKRTV